MLVEGGCGFIPHELETCPWLYTIRTLSEFKMPLFIGLEGSISMAHGGISLGCPGTDYELQSK